MSLDVVVVAYRSRELLRRCLASLEEHPPSRPMRVVVVDNDSGDGTADLVRAAFPSVDLVEAGRNLGFAAATNVGIRRSSGDSVLVLNPDTEVRPGTLDTVLAVLDGNPRVGIVGCRLELADGSLDHAARRAFPTVVGALGHLLRIGRRLQRGPLAQYRAPHVTRGPVDAVNGAFMLIRRRALEEVGLFDEGYWMYMEDLDLCRRFRDAGWTTWYEPDATALHVKGGTTGGRRSLRLVLAFHYGMFRFYRRHRAGRGLARIGDAVVYAGIAVTCAFAALRTLAPRRRAAAT